MQVMARITGLVGMFLGNSRRTEWFTSVVVGLWTKLGHNLQAYFYGKVSQTQISPNSPIMNHHFYQITNHIQLLKLLQSNQTPNH